MESLGISSLSGVKYIPDLYISDRFAARSPALLRSLGIKYILSVTHLQDVPKFAEEEGFVGKHVEIEDDVTEDLIVHLQGCCDWIDERLSSLDGEDGDGGGVLVHCTQGISRSAAVVIGFLMRTLQIDFDQALAHVRVSRPQANPNEGFEYQLKVWQQLSYDVFDSEGREKEGYKRLQEQRVRVLVGKEDALVKERFKGVAVLVADIGKMRGEEGEWSGKSEAWERVEMMEEKWRRSGGEVEEEVDWRGGFALDGEGWGRE
ncbi:hypothetical protein HYFRA_00008761, partial [Hymenoscyphus fraxineus]